MNKQVFLFDDKKRNIFYFHNEKFVKCMNEKISFLRNRGNNNIKENIFAHEENGKLMSLISFNEIRCISLLLISYALILNFDTIKRPLETQNNFPICKMAFLEDS
jgi:hypothetical protein